MERNHYIVMAKTKNTNKYRPISGIDKNGNPLFVYNRIHALVLWDIHDSVRHELFQQIREKYPNINFDFRKTD